MDLFRQAFRHLSQNRPLQTTYELLHQLQKAHVKRYLEVEENRNQAFELKEQAAGIILSKDLPENLK